MDTVLGVSMAPTAVRMVLVEGENGDGATVEEDKFNVSAGDDEATFTAADQVVSAILGTREGAAEGGYQLASTGVTFTDPIEAAALRDALAAHKVENVMLVSAFLAAAALAQTVGNHTNYAQTALLYIEPDSATLAVVDSADGSITDVRREALPDDDDAAVAQLASMVSGAEALPTQPDAVFVVGSGIDIPHDQARTGGGDHASVDRAGGAGHGAGQGSRPGVGECAAVRVIHRGARLRAGSRHRCRRPVGHHSRLL